MTRVDDFDAFYHEHRRAILHQTYALTGHVERAASAVEHGFARACGGWRRVRRLDDPAGWVRTEAWRVALGRLPRRRLGPLRQARTGAVAGAGRSDPDDSVAFGDLPAAQRKAVVLRHLVELPHDRIARELGVSPDTASSLLAASAQSWAGRRTPVGDVLAALAGDLRDVRLLRASAIRRAARTRKRRRTLLGLTATAVVLAGAAAVVVDDGRPPLPVTAADAAAEDDGPATRPTATSARAGGEPEPFRIGRDDLLTGREVGGLTVAGGRWAIESTTDGTTGDPVYSSCQREPFADPAGKQALVRRFASSPAPGTERSTVSAVQVLEESRDPADAARAFDTMRDWFGRCTAPGVQLLRTVQVDDLGDEAAAFTLRRTGGGPGGADTFLTVALARSGPVTAAVVGSSPAPLVTPRRAVDALTTSVNRLCLSVSGDCTVQPELSPTAPPPLDEHPGFVSALDLPGLSDQPAPWVGTGPRRSLDDPAATPCDRTNFTRAQHPRTRVFVLPTAPSVPQRVGLAETVGRFTSKARARDFLDRAERRVSGCADRVLGASVTDETAVPGRYDGTVWRLELEISDSAAVVYRVGIVRVGRRVALLSMSPTQRYDATAAEFEALLVRAGQRLDEVR